MWSLPNRRQEAAQLVIEAIGEQRMRELRSEGEAIDSDQASSYARAHIDEYVATHSSN
jgi:hypothetical protein